MPGKIEFFKFGIDGSLPAYYNHTYTLKHYSKKL